MASFFKKALGVFVEFEDEQNKENFSSSIPGTLGTNEIIRNTEFKGEAEKFEKYFDRLFDQANFPGPDYFEFHKMMEALETPIPDEKTRMSATFASLSIQGLTKQILIDTANKYKAIIEKDKADFELALNNKLKIEIGDRQKEVDELQQKIVSNTEQIQKLTAEISESQTRITKLKGEVTEETDKQKKNNNGYQVASQAILSKISSDIQKIQTTL